MTLLSGQWGRALRTTGRFALDLVLPPTCSSCGEEVDQPHSLCPACFIRMHPIGEPRCDQCGVPLPASTHLGRDARCVSCELHPPVWSKARAAYVYDEGPRDLILSLKYADRTQNAIILARQMNRAGRDILEQADWLIPVPVHWRRLLERKYNQAALLARAVSRLAVVPVFVDALQRPRATSRLASFSADERAREMQDAIRVRPRAVDTLKGRRVVLVDDILTTGSTAAACTSVLLSAGAASVCLLAAARTTPDAQEDISQTELPED